MRSRRTLEWGVPLAATVAVPLVSLALADRLPDPIAIHWGLGGRPDGAGPLWPSTALMTAVVALLGLGPIASLRRVPTLATARVLVASAHGMAVFLLALHLASLVVNLDVASWREAEGLDGGALLGLTVLALPFAAVGWVLPSDRRYADEEATAARPVAAGEAVVWRGWARTASAWPVAILVVLAGLALWVTSTSRDDGWMVASLVVAAVVATVLLAGVRVTVGPTGVHVATGLVPWPSLTVPLGEIEDVEVVDVRPMAYGGWGYRVVPGTRAVVVRAGEGLRLTRLGGRPDLVVTVDDAATGAGVLLAHLGR